MNRVIHRLVILLGLCSLAAQADITLTAPAEMPVGAKAKRQRR